MFSASFDWLLTTFLKKEKKDLKKLIAAALLVGLATASCSGGSSPVSPPLSPQAAPNAPQANFPTTEAQAQSQSLKTLSVFLDSLRPNAPFTGGFSGGSAYAVSISPGAPIDVVGPSCTSVNSQQYTAGPGPNIPGILTATTAFAYYATKRAPTSLGTVSRGGLEQVNMFSGIVTATVVDAYAVSAGTANTLNSNATFGTFVNLKVFGIPVKTPIKPNTVIPIPGVGILKLNLQSVSTDATSTSADQTQMQLTLTNSLGGLPAGTVIVVGHAHSSFTRGTTCP